MKFKMAAKTKKQEHGSAVLIVLALLAMLTSIAIMSVDRSNTDMELSANIHEGERAFYLAEAGLARGVVDINKDNSWKAGYNKELLEGGYYSLTVTDSLDDPTLMDSVVFRSQGVYISGVANVESWLVPVYYYPFRYGMFAGQGINFDQKTCVDSYNSDSGTYAATQLSKEGDIGTNGNITTSTSVTIGGDAYTARGGKIILGPGSKVTGDTSTTKDSTNLAIIPDSEYVWASAVSNAPAGLSGANYTYDAATKTLTTGKSGVVLLQSGVYYFSSVNLGQMSNIALAPGANVTIYVTNDIVLNQYSTVNLGGSPAALQIYSQKGSLKFSQYNTFYGTFYGPYGDIQFDQTSQVYGSLVGNSIQIDQGACFHYDRSLSRSRHGTTGEMIAVAWRQLE